MHPLKAEQPIDETESGIITSSNEQHSLKAQSSMLATGEEIFILVKDTQLLNINWNTCVKFPVMSSDAIPLKTHSSMLTTEEGISISVNDEQSTKAPHLIDVTESGIVIFFNDLHPLKRFLSIDVTEEGIVISASDVQQLKTSSPM